MICDTMFVLISSDNTRGDDGYFFSFVSITVLKIISVTVDWN